MREQLKFEFLTNLFQILSQDIEKQKVSHAYVFYGSEGTGKKTMARRFAAALLCQHPVQGMACGTCENCRLNQGENHPDFYLFTAEGKKSISVDRIREMIRDVYIKPFMAPKKVYVIADADLMTPAAQNALLKVLEEPPAYAVFILICHQISNLLDTVLSRTVSVYFQGAAASEIAAMLAEEFPSAERDLIVSSANGSMGYAKKLAQDSQVIPLQKEAAQLLGDVIVKDEMVLFKAIRFFEKQKEDTAFLLDFWIGMLRDALLLKANRASYIAYMPYRDVTKKIADKLSLKAIVSMMDSIRISQKMLARYINLKEVMYQLLLQIEEDRNDGCNRNTI